MTLPQARTPARARAIFAWFPHAAPLGFVLLAGLAVRVALASSGPVLLMGDSETYLGPAIDLERGAGFELALKRTPGYPLLLAAVLGAAGEDLFAVTAVQHALGLLTATVAYLLASALGGRAAGLLAGLATALAGSLLLYERSVMTETLFASLLTASVAALVAAARRPGWVWPVVAGLAIGAATLVRPVAQALLLLAPVALLLSPAGGWRRVLLGTVLVAFGYGLVLAPWTIRGTLSSDGVSVGALGQTLVGRTARHDRRDPATDSGFVFFDPARDADDPDQARLAARKVLQEAANNGSSGRAVHTRLRRDLGLSEQETDRLMRDLALEAIARRPGYYVSGTVQRFLRLWVTAPERLRRAWADQGTIRARWEHAASAPLLAPLPTPSEAALASAESLIGLFQPARLGLVFPALFALGLAAALLSRRHRPTLVPALASIGLIGLSVALVGGVDRYRYPEDSLIFVVIAVGLAWVAGGLRRLVSSAGERYLEQ